MTNPCSVAVEVTIIEGYRSVCVTVPVRAGDTVLEFAGEESPTPSRHSLQVGPDRHLVVSATADRLDHTEWQFVNHSCAPNTYVRGRSLVAVRDIATGEEVTFDYNTTEWEVVDAFECGCGHPSCVRLVRGYRRLDAAAREARRPITAAYLLEMEPLIESRGGVSPICASPVVLRGLPRTE
jgi:hypothetical protein